MQKITISVLGGTALLLAVAFAAAVADDAFEPMGGAMFIHGGGGMHDSVMPMPFEMPVPPPGAPFHLMRMVEELDLSADQRKEIGAIMDETMPKMRDLMFRMADSRKALRNYLEGAEKEEGALRKITDEHGKQVAEMMFLHLKSHADMHAVLTEDQLKKLERHKHMHHTRRFGTVGRASED